MSDFKVRLQMEIRFLAFITFKYNLFVLLILYPGAYAAFSAGGGGGGKGGVHFKLEQTSCQQSLKYISLYNTEGAPFSTEKRNIFLCM